MYALEQCAGLFFSAAAAKKFLGFGGGVDRLEFFFRRLRRRLSNTLSAAAAYVGANSALDLKLKFLSLLFLRGLLGHTHIIIFTESYAYRNNVLLLIYLCKSLQWFQRSASLTVSLVFS